MFKKIASKIKSLLFKAQGINPDSATAKAQAKIIDDLANQVDAVAEIAKDATKSIVADAKRDAIKAAKKEVADAKKGVIKAAKKVTAPKVGKVGPRPEDAARAANAAQAKKSRPKKSPK